MFNDNLSMGQTGESLIAKWFQRRGHTVLPVYEKIMDTGKGPQLFMPKGKRLIAPDMLIFSANDTWWIEAKHKTAFTWYRNVQCWQTGIDKRHYFDYLQVNELTPWPVWLLFLHRGGQAKDSPPDSPSGLFGNTLDVLQSRIDHISDRHGRSGMVYWNIHDLRLMAGINEFQL